jgi:hypothetical protein
MVDADAYAFRLPEVYATACATCYLPLDEIRITDGWQRQRVAAPRGSNSLHHRACVLGVPSSPYRDCPARDAEYEYDPDLACTCGAPVTRETARADRACILVAHQNKGVGDGDRGIGPRVRLYHERCVLGGDRPVLEHLIPGGGGSIENLAALAFVHTRGTETPLSESAMHVLAPGYSLRGVPIFAWAKSAGSPELDRDKGERSARSRSYYEAARTLLPPDLVGLGARRVESVGAEAMGTLLHHDGAYAYVECKYDGKMAGVYPFVASGPGTTGSPSYGGGGGASVGLIRLASGAFLAPQRWIDMVATLQADECRPTHGRASVPRPLRKERSNPKPKK